MDRPGPSPSEKSYRVVAMSIYKEDLNRMDELVEQLKAKHPRANRSQLVRMLLDTANIKELMAAYRRYR